MDDREILEWAAKAHGGLEYVADMGWIAVDADGNRGAWWHPLTDDGDALRLAVKLGITISIDKKRKQATQTWTFGIPQHYEPHWNDPDAATRRSITRAAAAIGEQKGKGM